MQEPSSVPHPPGPSAASRLAVLSFATGLIFCCPGSSIISILAGSGAFIAHGIRPRPDVSWRKYAIGGICMGLISLVSLFWLYEFAHQRWEQEWRVLLTGPNNALYALQENDLALFRQEFEGPAASLSDEAIQRFATEVREQLGLFQKSESDLDRPPEFEGSPPWELGGFQTVFASEKEGEWAGVVESTIGIEQLQSGTLRLGWILIEGEGPTGEAVRIRYPAEVGQESDPE